jgi:hypothetical protein
MDVPAAACGEESDCCGQIPQHPGPDVGTASAGRCHTGGTGRAQLLEGRGQQAGADPAPLNAGSTRISGMLPALSTAANPTEPVPASATKPSPSSAMPAGSSGQDQGIAARHSLSTSSQSAAAANGRIRHRTPVSIPPASGERRNAQSGWRPS